MKHTDKTKKLLSELRTTHGCSQPWKGLSYRTWLSWRMMFQRCENPNHKSFKDYGGRGIKICDRWDSFENFLEDMGVKPAGMTLGRIDNDGDYEWLNCEWQTNKKQCNNRRSNTILTLYGETHTLQEWADKTGIARDTIYHRIKAGWELSRALTQPPEKQINSRSNYGSKI